MSSLLTNTSAMTALQNLAATQKSLTMTQAQISSGLRVASASDNAAYWSISTTMQSDTGALSAVTDALNLGASVVNTASSAMKSVLSILSKMKQDLVTAQTPGTSASQVQTDISAQQASLTSIISSASFNGVNLLDGSTSANNGGVVNVIASFSRNSTGQTTLGTIGINTGLTVLGGTSGLLGAAISGTDSNAAGANTTQNGVTYDAKSVLGFAISSNTTTADYTALSAGIDAAITSVTTAGATLGQASTNITNQATFVSAMSDAITSGVGSLVDADMNVASTRLQALQTQQQLGIQSLSIANQNSQLILKLFQG